jgi:hypothetical protein
VNSIIHNIFYLSIAVVFDLPLGLCYSMTTKMTRDFFIHLTFAAYKVAGLLSEKDPLGRQIRDSVNQLLASLLLLVEENLVMSEQKRSVLPRAIRELGVVVAYLNYAKRTAQINPGNFLILEREYNKIGELLRKLHEEKAQKAPTQTVVRKPEPTRQAPPRAIKQDTTESRESLSGRQTRILEIIRNKDKTQVWELQKVLPEVTKRTLRRDLDDLLNRRLIIRQGEWNEVFYQVR